MPSFAGVNIFGLAVQMTTALNPRDRQLNAYPGLNGIEALDGGSRGLVTSVRGMLHGAGASGLAAVERTFLGLFDGKAYPLVDTLGRVWPSVRLERYQPADRVGQDASGVHVRAYSAEFLHLGGP